MKLPAIALGLLLGFASFATADDPPKTAKRYICPPCPVDCHDQTFDKPGRCPQCGMTLVERDSIRNVAILVWDGVELLDFAGPGEVFAAARVGDGGAFNVFTVAATAKPVTSQGFLKITPNHTIENCPPPHILVIPGGNMRPVTQNEKLMSWIREQANKTEMILSVCTGAFVLAQADLLDDIAATTWHGAIDALRREAPKTTVHDDRRFVDNGDIITAAGVSAGIDGALHAVSRLCGPDVARRTARYMEYEWRPNVPRTEFREEIKRRIGADPDGVLYDLRRCLDEGTREATEVLADAALFGLHENPKFRELIRDHTFKSAATLVTADEPGEPLIVSGRVLNEDGKPVSGALLYVFHTGNDGSYSSKGGNVGNMGDSLNPRIFGYLRTGADGRYEYRTIRPAHYPRSGPPAHVHYEVSGHDYKTKVTELMFEGDSRMTAEGRREIERAGFVISRVTRGDDGVWRCSCDVTLEQARG